MSDELQAVREHVAKLRPLLTALGHVAENEGQTPGQTPGKTVSAEVLSEAHSLQDRLALILNS